MYPFEIKGIVKRGKDQPDVHRFALSKAADKTTLLQLIRDIPHQTEIMFYDKNFPSPSDPGAYVSFMQVDNQYVIRRSNHGWSSKWAIIDIERLESYLTKSSSIHKLGMLKAFEEMYVSYQVEPPSSERLSFDDDIYNGQTLEPERNNNLKTFLTALIILLLVSFCFAFYFRIFLRVNP